MKNKTTCFQNSPLPLYLSVLGQLVTITFKSSLIDQEQVVLLGGYLLKYKLNSPQILNLPSYSPHEPFLLSILIIN